jgi:hypothetical protein
LKSPVSLGDFFYAQGNSVIPFVKCAKP